MDSTGENLNVVAATQLQPGESIKPNVDRETAIKLIKTHFGYDVTRIKELNSYDDINFYIEANLGSETEVKKFVFKILNSMDSKKPGHIQAENDIMLLLKSKGINCSVPQKTVGGGIYAIVSIPFSLDNHNTQLDEKAPSKNHLIRLLTFVPGILFYDTDVTENLLYEAGSYIAQIENHLKGFKHVGLENHSSIWIMSSTPSLTKFLYVLDEQPERQKLVLQVLSSFQERVVPAYPQLEKGVVHGDFNEQNILCRKCQETGRVDIDGVIDFGDVHEGFYLFELAITICYMMLECVRHGDKIDPFVGGGHVIAGYSKFRPVPKLELDLLKICISSRLCTSLVMGAYSFSQDPGNTYLLTTAKTGWNLLERLHQTSEEQITGIWTQVLHAHTSTNHNI